MKTEEIRSRILEIISEFMDEDVNIADDLSFEEYGFDSLDHIEVIMLVEEEFDINIPDHKHEEIKTMGDLIDIIFIAFNTPTDEELEASYSPPPKRWFEEKW